jgi:glycosyltransferase involved in cell wall biosynthesis
MSVSIALATYNGRTYIRDQLVSIAAQTEQPGELVVSDDGSTDDTLDIVREFARSASFQVIVLPPHEQLGFADNFLHAAAHCKHEYVMFCDQDDIWLPNKIERGFGRVKADGGLLSLHRMMLTDERLEPLDTFSQGIRGDNIFEALELEPYMTGWGNTMLFKRELATLVPRESRPKQPGMERLLSHDTWIYTLAAALGRVSHINDHLILYRQHGTNVLGVRNGTLSEKWREWITAPVTRYRDREAFNRTMSEIFFKIAHCDNEKHSAAAAIAAKRYSERQQRVAARVAMFEAPTLLSRLHAFQTIRSYGRVKGGRQLEKWLSAAKDFALGVVGLGRRE